MGYENALVTEINKELDRLELSRLPWRASFVAHAICNAHADGLSEGEHKDFWRHCGYEKTRDAVRRCINRRAGDADEEEDRQYRLPGYDHVHLYYVVRRKKEDIGVPVEDLTDDEIDNKSDVYRKMGRNCFAHANELQRFKRERKAVAARPSPDLYPAEERVAS